MCCCTVSIAIPPKLRLSCAREPRYTDISTTVVGRYALGSYKISEAQRQTLRTYYYERGITSVSPKNLATINIDQIAAEIDATEFHS